MKIYLHSTFQNSNNPTQQLFEAEKLLLCSKEEAEARKEAKLLFATDLKAQLEEASWFSLAVNFLALCAAQIVFALERKPTSFIATLHERVLQTPNKITGLHAMATLEASPKVSSGNGYRQPQDSSPKVV